MTTIFEHIFIISPLIGLGCIILFWKIKDHKQKTEEKESSSS